MKKVSLAIEPLFGLPLVESEVEVRFHHHDKEAVAVFEISGGSKLPGSREFPPEVEDPTVEFVGAYIGDDQIPTSEIDIDNLEELAVEKYWDQLERE